MKATTLFFYIISSSILFCSSANAQANLKSMVSNSFNNYKNNITIELSEDNRLAKYATQAQELFSNINNIFIPIKNVSYKNIALRFEENSILLISGQVKKGELAQKNITNQNFLYLIVSSSLLLALTLGAIIYWFFLRNKKFNEQLSQKNQAIILLEKENKNQIETQQLELKEAKENIVNQQLELKQAKKKIKTQQLELKEAKEKIKTQQTELIETNSKLENTVKERANELMSAYQELLVAHEELDSFMYRSSHDLKGPIARLIGLCYVSKLDIGNNTNLEYFEKLEDTAKEMDAMLQRLIRVGDIKITDPDYSQVNLEEAIKNAVFDVALSSPDISVETNTTLDYYETDSFFLDKILENLIQNAKDYIDRGKDKSYIKINIRPSDNKGLKISVLDNGIGIPSHIKDRVFHMFYKGTEKSSGAGLGLYEVKLIVQKLNGKAYINSENKTETEVVIDLPAL